MHDLAVAPGNANKLRRDWGLQNTVGITSPMPQVKNDVRARKVKAKIDNFVRTAVYPQQLTVPRQYATTDAGCWIYEILEGRQIVVNSETGAKYREKGVRVVVQENAQQARFVMSKLFDSKADALSWAVKEMGAEI